jgi:hypothetical protein
VPLERDLEQGRSQEKEKFDGKMDKTVIN